MLPFIGDCFNEIKIMVWTFYVMPMSLAIADSLFPTWMIFIIYPLFLSHIFIVIFYLLNGRLELVILSMMEWLG